MMFSDDDYVDPHEYDDLMETSRQILAKDIANHIAKNKDKGSKHVGDRVLVWDCSRLTDFDTNTVNYDVLDHELLSKYPSIVIEENCKYNADLVIDDRVFPLNHDLVVWNKTIGKKYRTNSDFVKRTDKPV